uniref:Putative secreted protein n=1 Tax=Anopheles marajoara TaxID=58244 RepID=A0A2M4C9M8_9DIPT
MAHERLYICVCVCMCECVCACVNSDTFCTTGCSPCRRKFYGLGAACFAKSHHHYAAPSPRAVSVASDQFSDKARCSRVFFAAEPPPPLLLC